MDKKIYEFIKNEKELISKIEQFIFFDEIWRFPGFDSLEEFTGVVLSNEFKITSKLITDELNRRKIDTDDYTIDLYYGIIKSLVRNSKINDILN